MTAMQKKGNRQRQTNYCEVSVGLRCANPTYEAQKIRCVTNTGCIPPLQGEG
jgi:hypothetical protein